MYLLCYLLFEKRQCCFYTVLNKGTNGTINVFGVTRFFIGYQTLNLLHSTSSLYHQAIEAVSVLLSAFNNAPHRPLVILCHTINWFKLAAVNSTVALCLVNVSHVLHLYHLVTVDIKQQCEHNEHVFVLSSMVCVYEYVQ